MEGDERKRGKREDFRVEKRNREVDKHMKVTEIIEKRQIVRMLGWNSS